jgi:hypothetical protein
MVRNLVHVRRESATGAAQNTDRGVFFREMFYADSPTLVFGVYFHQHQRQRDEYF